MAYTEIITLLDIAESKDAGGDITETLLSEKEVFAEYRSVGQKEMYQAAAAGLRPEHTFRLADYLDYNGQRYISWNGTTYKVFRHYRAAESTELDIVVTGTVNEGGGAVCRYPIALPR